MTFIHAVTHLEFKMRRVSLNKLLVQLAICTHSDIISMNKVRVSTCLNKRIKVLPLPIPVIVEGKISDHQWSSARFKTSFLR